ncbi:MAG TPA: acetoin utilization protein AcuC [Methanomassiliicoccales archaeon]|nr:acetoin utilization protein AcuC [Methanomassiliicoccales archaeon]
MSGTTAFYYSDRMLDYYFGPEHPFQPVRYQRIMETLRDIGAFGPALQLVEPPPAKIRELRTVHAKALIEQVRQLSAIGSGYLDRGDTPVTPTLFEGALAVTGATIAATEAVAEGRFQHGLNPAGGMHHSMANKAAGFCVFNDLAIAVRILQRKYGYHRIAIIDIDGHHGDGTQEIFYEEEVLTISLHQHGHGFFPGTGTTREVGKNSGYGYNINLPLPAGVQDETYLNAYQKVVTAALDSYQPEFILHQFGTDAHFGDCLVDLGLTTKAYETIAERAHDMAHKYPDGRLVVTGGGGYNIDAARRIWALAACAISGAFPSDPEALHHLQDSRIHPKAHYRNEMVDEMVEDILKNAIPLMK